MRTKLFCIIVLISIKSCLLYAQKHKEIKKTSKEIIDSSWNDFYELLSLPNDGYDVFGIQKNIEWTERTLKV